jgi:transcriptional regulator with XRE-family HTH domain
MQRLYDEFGKRLRAARREARLSQENVAERVGLTRSSIANIELGRQRITLHTLYALAGAVQSRPAALLPEIELLGGEEELLSREVLDELSQRNQDLIQEVLEGGRQP